VRIKVLRRPDKDCIDGIRLDRFVPGFKYEVGQVLGTYLVVEGCAEPLDSDDPAVLTPLSELAPQPDRDSLPNVRRELFPPYYDGPPSMAYDRRRRKR